MKSFSLVLALLFMGGAISAEQLFIVFDGTCGERIRYEQAVAQQTRTDYYAYSFKLNSDVKLILETGVEGYVTQSYLPEGYIYCGDARLNAQFADRVNSTEDRVFILLPTANQQYLVQPVVMAAVLENRGENLTYQSPMSGFQFDADNAIIGVNLAYNNENINGTPRVYFEGREESPCSEVYLFRQLNPNTAYPIVDYKIVPELGLLERRLGSDGVSTTGGVIVAREVNGQPIDQYLNSLCMTAGVATYGGYSPTQQPYQNQPATYGNQGVATPQPYTQPESAAYNNAPAAPPTRVTHKVNKGETLYAISKRYGTTVDAIKATNGLTSNTVYVGQDLEVMSSSPAAIAQAQPATRTTVPTMPYNPGNVANSNPGANVPTPYSGTGGQPAAPQAYDAALATRGQEPVYGENVHIVQPGETVASVALKYGYTSAKLREINKLGSNEVVKVGQRISTSDCNCPPAQAAAPAPAPTQASNVPAPSQPATYSNPTPATYGTGSVTPQPYGASTTPSNTAQAAPAYRAPQNYGGGSATVAPTMNTVPEQRTMINNQTSFGEVVPNTNQAPPATMSELESRNNTPMNANATPSTYGSYTPPTPYSGAPSSTPNSYGGTPISPDMNYSQPVEPENRAFHLVQEGESLYSIARRYGMTVEQLRTLNNLMPADVIVPFQKLYVN